MKHLKNISAVLFMLLLSSNVTFSQISDSIDQSNNSTIVTLAKITLIDGTKLWGVLLSENEIQLVLNDFSAGVFTVNKSQIKSIDNTRIETNVLIETNNGSSFFGKITKIEGDVLFFNSELLGKVEIKTNNINTITLANAYLTQKEGAWFANPNATRYFFAPSAIPLKKKEGYYQNAYLLANSVSVGLTNHFTIGGGVVIPILFYVTPKLSYKVSKNVYLGGGVLFTQSFINDFNLSAGIGYGLFTLGNTEHNFTIGSGYGLAKNGNVYKETPWPIVTINGMTRIGKKLSLITENWLIPRRGYNESTTITLPNGMEDEEELFIRKNYYSYAASVGLRLMPGIKTSIDFSVVAIQPDPKTSLLVLPYLDFVYKFE